MTMPNFLVLGVGKAGTSSLNYYLRQHPEIGMAREKEPGFLIFSGNRQSPFSGILPRIKTRTLAEYQDLFVGTESKVARGEITPTYIAYPAQTICGIREYLDNPRMIAVFRQPVDRGYSNYLMHLRAGNEPVTDFSAALRAEMAGTLRPDHRPRTYLRRSFYSENTRMYLDAFPRNRFLFLLYDDLVKNPDAFFRSIFEFLGVAVDFLPETSIRLRVAEIPRWLLLNRIMQSTNPAKQRLVSLLPESFRKKIHSLFQTGNGKAPSKLNPALRKTLTENFRADILALQELIGRDLSGWFVENS